MLVNSYAQDGAAQVLSLNSSSGYAYLTGGSASTRTISLANHPLRDMITADNCYVCFGDAFTYSGSGAAVAVINYAYNTSTYVLTVKFSVDRLHPTEFSFDQGGWKLIVIF